MNAQGTSYADAETLVDAPTVTPTCGLTTAAVEAVLAESEAAAPDRAWIDFARLAAAVSHTAFASLGMAGGATAWCSAERALPPSAAPDHDPFIAHVAGTQDWFEIADTTADPRFVATPWVIDGQAVRSFAGCALRTRAGSLVGFLAVYGTQARALAAGELDSLRLVARQALLQMELRSRMVDVTLLSPGTAAAAMTHALLDSAPIAVYHTYGTSKMTYVNREYRRVFGLAPGQTENDWAPAIHEDDRARIEAIWEDFCANPRPMKFEYRLQPVVGVTRFVSEQLVATDGVPGFLGTISDFTDLAAARDDLKRQQTLLETVITDLPVALVACDTAGRITHHNRAALELHCVQTAGNFAPTYLADGVTPRSEEDRPLVRALRGETIGNLELVIAPPGEPRRITLSSARRLVGPDGQVLGAVAVVQDITARKQADLDLERIHKELMAASRQAGMAEVATNVLHNVGNILNSINISASLVAERVKQSKASGVSRVAALLSEQGPGLGDFMTREGPGKRIPEYLASLGEQLVSDQKITLQELASLRENLEHIKDTVAMQQNYAKLCGVTETVEVCDLVEDSLRLNAGAFARHGVTLERDFREVPRITVDKHKVLQILVNLVRNAKYACDESGSTDKRVTLKIEPAPDGVRIAVIDNGVGIPAENMSRLFSHGFTTRKSGHGFGLHSGALAAQELGGSLRAVSDGHGKGAAFILELPMTPRDADAHG